MNDSAPVQLETLPNYLILVPRADKEQAERWLAFSILLAMGRSADAFRMFRTTRPERS
jgi:hypothetical protein